MSYSEASQAQSSVSDDSYLGQVKWFNAKAGFGYITVMKGEKKGTDVFVHHSAINVTERQYKYLVQGEYVDFSIGSSKSPDHEYQVETVGGCGDGKLMCETRMANQRARPRRAAGPGRGGQQTAGGRGRGGRRATPRRETDGESKEQEVVLDNGEE